MNTKKLAPAVKKYMSINGQKGGAAGTGDSKRRSPAHYRRLVEIRRANKLKQEALKNK